MEANYLLILWYTYKALICARTTPTGVFWEPVDESAPFTTSKIRATSVKPCAVVVITIAGTRKSLWKRRNAASLCGAVASSVVPVPMQQSLQAPMAQVYKSATADEQNVSSTVVLFGLNCVGH